MERDIEKYYQYTAIDISTHTLTWSVTIRRAVSFLTRCISTHTLTWSVTLKAALQCQSITISTHTLTWSVTQLSG